MKLSLLMRTQPAVRGVIDPHKKVSLPVSQTCYFAAGDARKLLAQEWEGSSLWRAGIEQDFPLKLRGMPFCANTGDGGDASGSSRYKQRMAGRRLKMEGPGGISMCMANVIRFPEGLALPVIQRLEWIFYMYIQYFDSKSSMPDEETFRTFKFGRSDSAIFPFVVDDQEHQTLHQLASQYAVELTRVHSTLLGEEVPATLTQRAAFKITDAGRAMRWFADWRYQAMTLENPANPDVSSSEGASQNPFKKALEAAAVLLRIVGPDTDMKDINVHLHQAGVLIGCLESELAITPSPHQTSDGSEKVLVARALIRIAYDASAEDAGFVFLIVQCLAALVPLEGVEAATVPRSLEEAVVGLRSRFFDQLKNPYRSRLDKVLKDLLQCSGSVYGYPCIVMALDSMSIQLQRVSELMPSFDSQAVLFYMLEYNLRVNIKRGDHFYHPKLWKVLVSGTIKNNAWTIVNNELKRVIQERSTDSSPAVVDFLAKEVLSPHRARFDREVKSSDPHRLKAFVDQLGLEAFPT